MSVRIAFHIPVEAAYLPLRPQMAIFFPAGIASERDLTASESELFSVRYWLRLSISSQCYLLTRTPGIVPVFEWPPVRASLATG